MPDSIEIQQLLGDGLVLEDDQDEQHIHRGAGPTQDPVDQNRSPYERDYSRLLHCSSFRRLQRKLQLLPHGESDYYRTRLTHSLEVSQIAEGIAKRITLGGKSLRETNNGHVPVVDNHLLRYACLAHDIGNPPFGHAGELVLNKLVSAEDEDGFEGNAQTLRIIRTLEQRSTKFNGLNPTYGACMAVVKYFVSHKTAKDREGGNLPSKFLYHEDYEALSIYDGLKPRTLIAQIMDAADDIAYATHDLEDARKAGHITLEDLRQAVRDAESDGELEEEVVNALKSALKEANKYAGTRAGQVAQKALTSKIVGMLIHDIDVVELSDGDRSKYGTKAKLGIGFKTLGNLVEVLKQTAYRLVVQHPHVGAYELRGGQAIRNLFELLNASNEKAARLLPDHLQLILSIGKTSRARLVCDYLAGMTEDFLTRIHRELLGEELPPVPVD